MPNKVLPQIVFNFIINLEYLWNDYFMPFSHLYFITFKAANNNITARKINLKFLGRITFFSGDWYSTMSLVRYSDSEFKG